MDAAGTVVAAAGDPDLRSIARSAVKPIQALPLVADGGVEHFGLSVSELAVICGSHTGEDFHLSAVRSILRKAGLTESALHCGTHLAASQTAAVMRGRGEQTSPIHDNCSGKHAGMLAYAQLHGWDVGTYTDPAHPVQDRIREALAALTAADPPLAPPAVDGCSAPTYAVSLRELAGAFARLATPGGLADPWRRAAPQVTEAMMRFPEMVAGMGQFETVLMGLAPGRLFAKNGGEAIWALGIPARSLGLALKISDGGHRAVPPAAVDALRQLEILSEEDITVLAPHHRPPVLNRNGVQVGEMVPVFVFH